MNIAQRALGDRGFMFALTVLVVECLNIRLLRAQLAAIERRRQEALLSRIH